MTDNQNLRDALRQVARAVRTAPERQKDAAVFAAFDAAGGVKPEALQRSLPPLMLTWWLPGAVTATSNAGKEVYITGAIRLQDISVRAKTAPVGSECKVRLTANSMEVESVAIQPGQTFGRSTIASASAERAAGETLRVDVVTASGAVDVTVTLRYSLTGQSYSGGSSSGGGTEPVVSSVSSVNGATGVVVLDADDISDTSTSHKYVTAADLTKLAGISGTNTGDQDLSGYALTSSLAGVALSGAYADLSGKPTIPTTLVQLDTTVTGAQLNALKTKVDGIASGAEVNVNADWSAVSGDAQILNKPTTMTPTAHTHPVSDLTATGTRNSTTILYGDNTWKTAPSGGGATNLTSTVAPTQITVNSDTGTDAVLPATDGTNAGLFLPAEKTKLTGIAAGAEVNVQADWAAASGDALILNKPTLGTAAAMASTAFATAAQGTKADTAVQPAGLTKAAVGLGSVDNTSDAAKPVSTATQTALNAKADQATTYTEAEVNALLTFNKPITIAALVAPTRFSTTEIVNFANVIVSPSSITVPAGTYQVEATATVDALRSVTTGNIISRLVIGGVNGASLTRAVDASTPGTNASVALFSGSITTAGTVSLQFQIRGDSTAGTTRAYQGVLNGTLTRIS